MTDSRRWITVSLLLITILAYYLPWVSHPATALSPGARDLAEWTTLLPEMRGGSLPLMASFLLRFSFSVLTVIVAAMASRAITVAERVAMFCMVVIMVLALMPPVEFLVTAQSDLNYQQQFAMAVIAVIGSLVVSATPSLRSQWVTGPTLILLTLVTLVTAVWGLSLGLRLYQVTSVGAVVGPGAFLFIAGALMFGGEVLVSVGWRKSQTKMD